MTVLKNIGRAAIVALTLGGASLAAMPAQAAGNFQLYLGNGGGGFGFGGGNGGITLHFGNGYDYYDDGFDINYCLSDSQVRQGVRNKGYSQVSIVKELDDARVIVVGYDDGHWWQMRVNRCTGEVDHIKQIHKNSNGSFSITLNF